MSRRTGGPISRFIDLLTGRIHNRVIDLTQKANSIIMRQEQISQKLRGLAQQVRDDKAAIDTQVQALKDKITNGDEIDVDADFAALDEAVAGLDSTAGTVHSTAAAVSGGVAEDISGVSGPTGAASPTPTTGAGGQATAVSSPGGGAVDAQPAGVDTIGASGPDTDNEGEEDDANAE